MRVVLSIGLVACALVASTFIAAQSRNEAKDQAKTAVQPDAGDKKKTPPTKPAARLTSREALARLQLEIDAEPLREKVKFKVLLDYINKELETNDRTVTINLDAEPFVQMRPDAPDPFEEEVAIRGTRKRLTVMEMLGQAVKQIGGATYVVRAGRVDIIPVAHMSKEYSFNQTFRADFKDQRLDLALEELSDLTGVSLVIDGRAKVKAQTLVTARFNDDVALQDAVRMLTEMGDLKIVYMVTGMFITTPERAAAMQKELRQLYEGETKPMSMPPADGRFPDALPNPYVDPQTSPLAPPLPPLKGRRLEAAA
jgi:hypothetical protein